MASISASLFATAASSRSSRFNRRDDTDASRSASSRRSSARARASLYLSFAPIGDASSRARVVVVVIIRATTAPTAHVTKTTTKVRVDAPSASATRSIARSMTLVVVRVAASVSVAVSIAVSVVHARRHVAISKNRPSLFDRCRPVVDARRRLGGARTTNDVMPRLFSAAFVVLVLASVARRPRACARRLVTGARLTIRLARYSTVSWVFKLAGLTVYSIVLSPAFLRVAWTYATDENVTRGVCYGGCGRNFLALYFPPGASAARRERRRRVTADPGGKDGARGARPSDEASTSGVEKDGEGKEDADAADAADERRPVVIFVTGGMWIIGYKAWGALLAQRLARRGVIVASLDYRNFPQGTVGDMIADVGKGVGWVLERLDALGGDTRRVVVVGQSAGAHIAATCLLRQIEWVTRADRLERAVPNAWSPAAISRFIGISGVYAPDDAALIEHFHRQGLYKNVFWSIMEAGFTGARAAEALPRASPVSITRERDVRRNVRIVPPVMLCHGDADTSAPPEQSKMFAHALRSIGISVDERYYPNKTHTDPFVTDPILGRDVLLDDITDSIFGRKLPSFVDERPLVPKLFVDIARKFVPF